MEAKENHIGNMNISEKNVYEAYGVVNEYLRRNIHNVHMFKSFQLYLVHNLGVTGRKSGWEMLTGVYENI